MADPIDSQFPDVRQRYSDEDETDAQTELPARRAFVVQFHRNSALAEGTFSGRVEHVVSGQQRHFDSLAELTAFFSQAVIET